MNQVLNIIDDFHPNPELLRDAVLENGFAPYTGPDGAVYKHVCGFHDPLLPLLIERAIGKDIQVKLAGFRMDLAGEHPETAVHSDEICASHAGVLYLNLPHQCQGGTAFWKHINSGLDASPNPSDVLAELGPMAKAALHEDWTNALKWDQSGFAGMKFNRFITYPTRMFHSRYPREGFGSTPEDGRLVWVVFYDVKEGA